MINFLLKRRLLAYLIIGWAFFLGCLPTNNGLAMPITSEILRNEGKNLREANLQKIYSFLEEKIVQTRLTRMGIKSADLEVRLSALSDHELQRLATQMERVKLGGDAGGAILIIVLVVGLIMLILYLTGQSLRIETRTKKAE